jgi:uncharacterized protein (TIGR00255 family)
MLSMTGFGLGEATFAGGRLLLEVRSLNHRYLEIRVRLPAELTEHTFFLEQRCRQLLQRGRFDIAVRLEGALASAGRLDTARAQQVYSDLQTLRDQVFEGNTRTAPITLELVANAPGVLQASSGFDPEQARTALDACLAHALTQLSDMRQREGRALEAELALRLQNAARLCAQIKARSPLLVQDYAYRLKDRLTRLLQDQHAELDPTRLAVEVALLADKTDVTEELTRLESHFTQFAELCATDEPVGRRLDFLLQEVGREANTIGSKCPDADTAHLVVELKAELERLREQVQNVE